MDQRLFLAIALSMVVLIGYYMIFPPPSPQRPQEVPMSEQGAPPSPQGAAPAGQGTAGGQAPVPPAPAPQATATQPAAEPEPLAAGRTIVVETPRYRAEVDTRGGRLSSFALKDYRVSMENIDWADVIPPLRGLISKPQIDAEALEDMAPQPMIGAPQLGVELVGEQTLTREWARTVYSADSEADTLRITGEDGGPQTLVLTARHPDGLTVEKTLIFRPDSYIVDYQLAIANHGDRARGLRVASLFGEGPRGAQEPPGFRGHRGPIWRAEDDLETEDPDDVTGTFLVRDPEWVGITDVYFITVAQPLTPVSHAFYRAQEVPIDGDDTVWINAYGVELPQVELQPGKMIRSEFQLYLGPKKVAEMEKFGAKLESSLDLTLDVLAQPMLALMRWFHGFTNNYGVAIILLTIVVRVLLFPLTYRGMLNIKRMQKLQPRMVAMREKFKNDRERMNKEMMALYKKHKMNPLGGCLPIALQIPIFFALYSALLGAIELRHEPFFLWITDLSQQDGLYVTPLLMGASMVLQQKLTPTSVDPTQAKIMMWMPVIFTFFMLTFPAGLVLYWLTSNTLSIGQQLIINRINVPEPQD